MRRVALKMGVLASYLSDDFALDFVGPNEVGRNERAVP
jgi:hypothetical protein